MRKVKIMTDSCSDLTAELLKKYDIDYFKMAIIFEGTEKPALLEWSPEDVHAFYQVMRDGKHYSTSQVPANQYRDVFTEYLEKGYDIVYIGCSTRQSGSVNTGAVVAKKLLENYEDAHIFCIDSLNACIGLGMLAIRAAELAREGKDAVEINDYILAHRKNINEYVTVHSLDALRRAGRVKATSAFFGNLMGVKPIIIADAEGNQASYKKVKGRQNSFKEITALMKSTIVDPEEQTIYLWHADCSEEEVNALKEIVRQEIPCKEILTGYIGPIIGASVGPDTIGLWAFGETVTYTVNV